MIFVSTGAPPKEDPVERCEMFIDAGIEAIELSSGQYSENLSERLRRLADRAVLQVHNYFPPPKIPFILNLASKQEEVARTSMQHCRKSIQLAIELKRPIFSFHAGFLIDPDISQLGKRLSKIEVYDRGDSLSRFLERVASLSDYAAELGCELLIENNVVSQANFEEFGGNVFLAADPEEAAHIMKNTPDNVGMLIDTAHLKVSANSIGYDPAEMFQTCDQWIRAYHLSDNDGTQDSNEPIHTDSWFWPYLKRDLDYYSLEIYNVSTDFLVKQVQLTKSCLGQ